MLAISAAIHVVAIMTLVVFPPRFGQRQPTLTSYTVELVAPDKLGGTNLVPGAKGKVPEPPRVRPRGPEQAAPPPGLPKHEPRRDAEPAAEPKGDQQPKPVQPPEPEKKDEAVVLAKQTPAPTATRAPEVALAASLARSAVRATQLPSTPAARSSPQPTPVGVAAGRPPRGTEQAARVSKTPEPASSAEARERDRRIAAAIRRIQEQAGAVSGGAGSTGESGQTGGPISVGPGEGAGGQVRGIEYLLYLNQMTAKIKQHWAWAGTNRSLKAVVAFSVLESGEIVNVRTIVSSGDPTYDLSVERAVKAASPLPPPPSEYRREFAQVEYTFRPEDIEP